MNAFDFNSGSLNNHLIINSAYDIAIDNLTISNNTFNNGTNAIFLYADFNIQYSPGIIIDQNNFLNQGSGIILLRAAISPQVTNNFITTEKSIYSSAISLLNCKGDCVIENNHIYGLLEKGI